jgi:hypothetical protein
MSQNVEIKKYCYAEGARVFLFCVHVLRVGMQIYVIEGNPVNLEC